MESVCKFIKGEEQAMHGLLQEYLMSEVIMGRTREYRREMRKQKIEQRRMKIKSVRRFYSDEFENGYIHGRKIQSAVFGTKGGLLSKGYYGAIVSGKKTKTKNNYASYRHKGGYGKAIVYSGHDMRKILRMEQERYVFDHVEVEKES